MRRFGFKALLIAAVLMLTGCMESRPGKAEVSAALAAYEADAKFLWKNYSDYFAIGAIDIADTLAQGNRHTVFFSYEVIVKEDLTPQKLQQIYAKAPDNTFPPLKIREFELVKLAEIERIDDHELVVRSFTTAPEGNILKRGDRLPMKDAKLTFLKTDQGWRQLK